MQAIQRGDEGGAPAWAAALEALDDVALLLNQNQVITYASPAAGRVLKTDPVLLVGRPTSQLAVRRLERDNHRGHRVRAGLGERVVDIITIEDAEGGRMPFEVTWARIPDPVGPGWAVLVRAREIETQVQTEAALARAEDRYHTLLSAMSEAALVLDQDFRVESFNQQALHLLRLTGDRLIGQQVFGALQIWDEDGRALSTPHQRILDAWRSGEVGHGLRSVQRGDGHRVVLRVGALPIADPVGPRNGYVMTLQDAVGPDLRDEPGPVDRRAIQAAAGVSPREGDVLDLLATGASPADIADQLRLSLHSVRGHIKNLMGKFGVHSQLQVVVVAARRGMVSFE